MLDFGLWFGGCLHGEVWAAYQCLHKGTVNTSSVVLFIFK